MTKNVLKFSVRLGMVLTALMSWCTMRTCRHDFHYRRTPNRIYLECAKCHMTTPGWDMSDVRPPRVIPGCEKADERYYAGLAK